MSIGAGVLVVGSLHQDIMVAAPRLPLRGETLAGQGWMPKFGGKGGNQAVAAARAGAAVSMLGAVGDDGFGAALRKHLQAAGVDCARLRTVDGAASGMSVAITEPDGDYAAVIVSGANLSISVDWIEAEGVMEGVGVVLLQNEIPEAANLAAASRARAEGRRVCLNAAPFRPLPAPLLEAVDLLVVNAVEAEQLCGIAVRNLASAARSAEVLAGPGRIAIVTAGAAGLAQAGAGAAPARFPAEPVAVVSTHGAGDAFVGTLAARLAAGHDMDVAVGDAMQASRRHVAGG